jgi:hypothetical protein
MSKNDGTIRCTLDTFARLAFAAVLLTPLLLSFRSTSAVRAAVPSSTNATQDTEFGTTPNGLTAAEWETIQQAIAAVEYSPTYPLIIDLWAQAAKLDPSDGESGDYFGHSVAVSGDTVVIGAHGEDSNGSTAGVVYVFEKDAGWRNGHVNQVARLDPDDGEGGDQFGHSVALDGDTLVVGAYNDDDPNGSGSGSVYVFEKDSGWADGHANQVAKLYASDGDSDDHFGSSVAIDGDTVVVGAGLDEHNGTESGSAYVFEKGHDGDSAWDDGSTDQAAKLDPSDGDSEDHFGRTVSVSGDTVVVGACHDEDPNGTRAGSAYVFEKDTGWSDGHANQVAKLDPSDGSSYDKFGASVGLDGDTLLVGAYDDDNGSAYIFEKGHDGDSVWDGGHTDQVAKLTASDGDSADQFGYWLAISGDAAVIGALQDEHPNGTNAGSAYVFAKGHDGDSAWDSGSTDQVVKLAPSDGDSGDYFGSRVDIDGDTVVLGAYYDEHPNGSNAGSAYVHERLLPEIIVAPASLAFGSQDVSAGATVSQTVTITNDGTIDLHITDISLTGGDAAHFQIESGGSPITLTTGCTHTVQASFDPTTAGAKSANLTIQSDDNDESTVDVALSGTGIDIDPPTFPMGTVLITPTSGITVTVARPVFDWVDATDNVGVVSYTLVLTGPMETAHFTATASTYTPVADLADGAYSWTVAAYDAAGNRSAPVAPESFSVKIPEYVFLPLVVRD